VRRGRILVYGKAISLLLIGLLISQASYAASYPLTITPGRSWPLSVVADSSRGLVYFDATSGEYPPTGFSFGIINATTHEVVKVLPLDVYPGAMVLDEASGDVYVAGSTSIAVFDAGNQSFASDIALGRPILSMAFDSSVSPDLYLTSGDSLLSLNPHTGAILGNASFSNDLDGVLIDPANGRLYVGQYPASEISVLNASNLAVVGTIGLPGCCALQLALDGRSQSLYAATGTNYVYMVNAGTDTFVKSVQVAPTAENSTNAIVADIDTGRIYVSSSPSGSIEELNGVDGSVVTTLRADNLVAGLAVDTKTQELYATNYHQLNVFDASRPRPLLTFLLIGAVVVVAGVIVVFFLLRRRESNERMKIQSGWGEGRKEALRRLTGWTC
jgi:DNA-binding beta-propeller fold protein YncE